MSEEHYGEPTDSLRSMMKILWEMENNLYELIGGLVNVNKEQITYFKKTAKAVDRITEDLQHIIDLGDDE